MKKITKRTFVCMALALLLTAGVVYFVFLYVTRGADWASFPSNRHLYANGQLKSGTVADRYGTVLAAATPDGWQYSADKAIRRGTLHAVGDAQGKIGTGAITRYAAQLSGYNLLTGAKPLLGGSRSLQLTIDADATAAAYQAMNGLSGTVGVYNYRTGEILVMVSTPTIDPQNPPETDEGLESGTYVNKLLSATFIPGSTFKIITATAALEHYTDVDTHTWHCDGSYTVGGQTVTCSKPHGDLTLARALTVSCNCIYAQLAVELGPDVMAQTVKKAGLTATYSVSGITTPASTFDFANEDTGILAWSGAGQGKDLVNPCALMVYAGAIANGGKAAVPQLISKLTVGKSLPTGLYASKSTGTLIAADTAQQLAQMMRDNVTNNYGAGNYPGLDMGAKSGTAQTGGEVSDAWFVGFLQDEDHPYAFIVLLQGGGSGSKKAGPVANTVLQALVSRQK